MYKIGIMMTLPEGKLPGYYAQIIKGIAQKAHLFDRDKEMLVVQTELDRDGIIEVLDHYKVGYDLMPLLLLPHSTEVTPLFTDYGFESRLEHRYLYADAVASFRLLPNAAEESELEQAILQVEEHLLARYKDESGEGWFLIDRELTDLVEGIAKAYRCHVLWS